MSYFATFGDRLEARWGKFPPGLKLRLVRAGIGLVAGAALIWLCYLASYRYLSSSALNREIEHATIAFLDERLIDRATENPAAGSVRVVDISSVQLAVDPHSWSEKPVTSRDRLWQVVSDVANARPIAIGIDVYFETDANGHLSAADEEFLDRCLQLETSQPPLRIYVGMYSIARGPAHWLGEERFSELGGAIVLPNMNGTNAPAWQFIPDVQAVVDGDLVHAPALSSRLSKAGRDAGLGASPSSRMGNSRWFGSNIQQAEGSIEAAERPLDVGKIQSLVAERIPAEQLEQKAHLLKGKIILIGRGTPGEATDMFNVSGMSAAVPGVYLHAAATETMLGPGLYALSQSGNNWLNWIFSAVVLLIFMFLKLSFSDRPEYPIWEGYVATALSVTLLWIGCSFAIAHNILWTGFVQAIVGGWFGSVVEVILMSFVNVHHFLEKQEHRLGLAAAAGGQHE